MTTQTSIPTEELRQQVNAIVAESIGKFIEEYVKEHEIKLKEISLIERIVKVEEELKSLKQIELERHESLQKEMNTRFEAMNTRFEALQKEMNTRFEAINDRFESLEKRLNFMQWLIATGIALISILHFFK